MLLIMLLKGKHLKTLKDYNAKEINYLLDLSSSLKLKMKRKEVYRPLDGYSMSMIFQKRSTRTRVSTETGITYLGGHALFLGSDDIQLGKNESLEDTALVLSRFNDLILARVFAHEVIDKLAKHSKSPIINALSDKFHPLQILADLLTIKEHFGHLEGLTISWVGDGNNVLNSLMVAVAKLGMNLRIATPKGYEPDEDVIIYAKRQAEENNTNLFLTSKPEEAVKGANIVITDTWVSMGEDEKAKQKKRDFEGYQVTMELCKKAADNWKFMHCLPRKENEVDDEVFYSERSIVFDEAENRMYTLMAVSLSALGLEKAD